jgi:hypothetical protein
VASASELRVQVCELGGECEGVSCKMADAREKVRVGGGWKEDSDGRRWASLGVELWHDSLRLKWWRKPGLEP